MLERLFALETFGIKLGLDNIRALCAALDHPERSFATIHVAGTNGKGSVTAMVHTALHAAGLRAARYTSPHLSDLAERFVIGLDPVEHHVLDDATCTVLDAIDRMRDDGTLAVIPTFFEATTAIGFELFRRAGVQVAVIEVGLGGRFDATNVIAPIATAITTIGLDHQQHLGTTLAAIAREKAGIIKPATPVVIGALVPEAHAVVARTAQAYDAPLIEATHAVAVEAAALDDGRATLGLATSRAHLGPLTLGLSGAHQIGNAQVAVALLDAARAAGIPVSPDHVRAGLEQVYWPARLELLHLPGGRQVLIDAAHNAEGARALAVHLGRWYPQRVPLILGVMRDKDVDAIVGPLLPVTSTIVATAAPTPRAMPAHQLADHLRHLGAVSVRVCEDPADAVMIAIATDPTICVAGSIFLAGAVRDALKPHAMLG